MRVNQENIKLNDNGMTIITDNGFTLVPYNEIRSAFAVPIDGYIKVRALDIGDIVSMSDDSVAFVDTILNKIADQSGA